MGPEVVRHVQLVGGAGLDAHRRVLQFAGAGHAELAIDQEALAVEIGDAGEVDAQRGIPRAGP